MARGKKSSEAQFARIVTTDENADTHGFFWCGGGSWATRDYRCVLLAKSKDLKLTAAAAIEIRSETPEGLAEEMGKHDMDPMPADEIRKHCESAPSSPRRPRAERPHAG